MSAPVRIFICDSDLSFLPTLSARIDESRTPGTDCRIEPFPNGHSLLERFARMPADVVFLNMDAPIGGFELAGRLNELENPPILIFITDCDDTARQAWAYQPFWFISKSHPEELIYAFPKIMSKLEAMRAHAAAKCLLTVGKYMVDIRTDELISVESVGHNVLFRFCDGTTQEYRGKIADVVPTLLEHGMIRVQMGVLVGCRYVLKITSHEVTLSNGITFGLSRSLSAEAREKYREYEKNEV